MSILVLPESIANQNTLTQLTAPRINVCDVPEKFEALKKKYESKVLLSLPPHLRGVKL